MKRGLLTFAILLLVLGTISGQTCHVGDLFTFSDGSKGVVFHIDADGAVDLFDAVDAGHFFRLLFKLIYCPAQGCRMTAGRTEQGYHNPPGTICQDNF